MKLLWILLVLLLSFFSSVGAQDLCGGLPIVSFDQWGGDLNTLINGFCVNDTVSLWYQSGLPDWRSRNTMPEFFSTRALWQDPGVIERSAAYNGLSLEGYDGAVALTACSLVGTPVYGRRDSGQQWLRLMVSDCAAPEHAYFHAVYNWSGVERNTNWRNVKECSTNRESGYTGIRYACVLLRINV